MAKWHEPFLWSTIRRVGDEEFPDASEELKEKIYDTIMGQKNVSFTIDLIERLYREGL